MKLLSLAVPAALLVFACTAGTGTLSTGTGPDPSPTTGDKPPSSTDPPGTSTDPSGSKCITCAGSYVCTGAAGTQGFNDFEVDLSEVNGLCYYATSFDQGNPVAVDPCTRQVTSDTTVTPTNDGFQVCITNTIFTPGQDGGGGTQTRIECYDCRPGKLPKPTPTGSPDAG